MNLVRSNWKQDGFLTTLVISIIVFVMAGCATDQEKQEQDSDQGTPVSVVEVRTEQLKETTEAIGTLEASKKVELRPEISGNLQSIEFSEGDTVSEGDVLFRIEDDELEQRLNAVRANLRKTRAILKNARQTYQRKERLHKKELTSAQDRDNALEAFETAKAQVQQLEARVSETREKLEDATIKAPYSGIMGSHEIDEGNYIQPGQHLSTLYRISRIEVSFTVPERLSGRVKKDQTIKLNVNAYPDRTFSGSVYYVSPSVEDRTRSLLAKGHISNSDRILKPGMFARVNLLLRTRESRPVVPSKSLVATRDGYVVFRIEDGTASRQPVKIGLRQPGLVEIRDGLTAGETIVLSGHMSITDGSDVKILKQDD